MNINPASNDDTPPLPVVDPSARQARLLLTQRRARRDHLPDILFGEPGWECLLQLYVAEAERRQLSTEQCVRLAAAPPSTARRWIGLLITEGLAEQADSGILTLTAKARRSLKALFGQLTDGSSPPARRRPSGRGR